MGEGDGEVWEGHRSLPLLVVIYVACGLEVVDTEKMVFPLEMIL